MTDQAEPDRETETPPTRWQRFDLTDPEQVEPALAAATQAVRDGSCIVLPTDTVYGIGADSFSTVAVQRLLDAKGRGRDMPPPVLIADPQVMMALARDIPDNAKKLAERYWPGPLTLILLAQSSLQMDLGETRGTIAVRVPDHDRTRQLLRATGPLAVSSANRTGRPAATHRWEAEEQLGHAVAVYLDGGATPGPEPSTIVDFTTSAYGVVVRSGKISTAELRELVPYLEDQASGSAETETGGSAETAEPADTAATGEPGGNLDPQARRPDTSRSAGATRETGSADIAREKPLPEPASADRVRDEPRNPVQDGPKTAAGGSDADTTGAGEPGDARG